LVPHFLSLLGQTHSKWAGLSYISTKLGHSPQEINHYIKANIRTLWGPVVLCRKVRTNLSNLDQFDRALETLTKFSNFRESTIFIIYFSLLLFKCVSFRLDEPKNEQNTKNFAGNAFFIFVDFIFFFLFHFCGFSFFLFFFSFLELEFFSFSDHSCLKLDLSGGAAPSNKDS
jgi:hypothetical protein